MDTLGDISGSESETEEQEAAENSEPAKKKKVQAADPAPEELQALGLRAGPSILAVPEPQENGNPNWEWYVSALVASLGCDLAIGNEWPAYSRLPAAC